MIVINRLMNGVTWANVNRVLAEQKRQNADRQVDIEKLEMWTKRGYREAVTCAESAKSGTRVSFTVDVRNGRVLTVGAFEQVWCDIQVVCITFSTQQHVRRTLGTGEGYLHDVKRVSGNH